MQTYGDSYDDHIGCSDDSEDTYMQGVQESFTVVRLVMYGMCGAVSATTMGPKLLE
jgi:hypothetical protein